MPSQPVSERSEERMIHGNSSTPLRQAVLDALQAIAPQLAADTLNPAAPLRDQVDLDSMDWLNFLVAVHERLGVDVPEADYARLVTLDDLLSYLGERRTSATRGAAELLREHRLSDGRSVRIRPIRADDTDRIRHFLSASSEESRYKRFHKWVRAPSENLVHFLTDIDHDRHVALVCTTAQGREEIVGEARYIANPDGRSCEFGVFIEDAWRRTGIAGLLMEALIEVARERGFASMEGLVLSSNAPMLRFAHALGFVVEPLSDDMRTLRIRRQLQPVPVPILTTSPR